MDSSLGARAAQRFPASPSSVTDARHFVTSVLEGAGWQGLAVSSAELVASELAANAVLHARTPYEIEVAVDEGVEIRVTDASPSMPVLREPDVHALGGRGLVLVDQVSQSWGADPVPDGKCVWSHLDAEAGRWWTEPSG